MAEEKSGYRNVSKNISVTLSTAPLTDKDEETSPILVPHLHGYYEIYYNICGAKGFMANCDFYKCSERDLIIIPKLQAHKVVIKDAGKYQRCVINIDEYTINLIEILAGSDESLMWLKDETLERPSKVRLSPDQHECFMNLVQSYLNYEKSGESLEALSTFVGLLSFVKRCFETPQEMEYMNERSISYTDRIMKLIEKDFRTITVAEIATKLYSNRDHLNRIFKEDAGITLNRYLIMRKLAEAQKHLYMGKSVKEACVLAGFKDYANFLRTFKKYEGYTPGDFDGDEM